MSPRGAPPPIGAGTGEESVEVTPKKRKSETPAQAKQRLDAQKQAAVERYRKQHQERATRSAERASKSVPPITETTPVAATGATGTGGNQQPQTGGARPSGTRPQRTIDRSVVKGRSIGRQRTSDLSGDRGLHFRDPTSTAPPAQYLAQRAQQAQPTPVPPPTTTVTTPVATAKPTSRPKKRAKLPVLTLPRPTLQRVDFHKSAFTDLGIQIVKGKAMAKVSTSPYVPPPESLLILEEDMIPNLDIRAMPNNRVDDLYKETDCPYWDPRIKGHLIARLDVKTHQPISRAGRVLLNKAERDARVALKLQVKNRKRKLQTIPCKDPDLVKWQTWKQAAKAKEQMLAPSQQSANIPVPTPTPTPSPGPSTLPTSPPKASSPTPPGASDQE